MFQLFNKAMKNIIDGPLLSVVIPSYNHAKYIKEAVDSVLNQTYHNLELIIIDDGSNDNTLELLNTYNDKRMRIIAQSNQGAHNAINRGLQLAEGEYLTVLNSDDVYVKNRFEIMIGEMMQHPEVDFMCSYIRVINTAGKDLGVKQAWRNMEPWIVQNKNLTLAGSDDFKKNLLMWNFTSTTSNFLFTRKLYDEIGGMRNLRFAHDWDFALRAAEVTECMVIEKPLLKYRVHENNTISSNRKWMLFEIAWMWASNLERFYGKLLFKDEKSYDDIITLVESLNLQGNDKIFWVIMNFINAQKKLGIEKPEEILLDNNELRNKLLKYVVE